jgi:hypothetical protein|tara:strand:+ start:119 stop:436 length:318 start_codon:yes stop_codon:yes gene_type:complete
VSHFFQARFFSGGQTDFAEFIKQPKDGNALCSLRERERGKEEGKRERERERRAKQITREQIARECSPRERRREKRRIKILKAAEESIGADRPLFRFLLHSLRSTT